jgi:alpha-L-rhamnosidase
MWFQFLRTEDLDCPLALGTATPRLSWVLASDERDAHQVAYEVKAASSAALLKQDQPDLWDTGRIEGQSQAARYAGAPLRSRQRVYWQARVWRGSSPRSMSHRPCSMPVDVTSTALVTSPVRWFETGLLSAADWAARWVTHPAWVGGDRVGAGDAGNGGGAAEGAGLPVVRRDFTLDAAPDSARLYVAGVGVYVARINGVPVTDAVLEPPYSDFRYSVDYSAHDVTTLLHPGPNTLTLSLGTGIADVRHLPDRYTKFTGTQQRPCAIAQLEIAGTLAVASDGTWRAGLGPVRRSHWYGGEDHDARLAGGTDWCGAAEVRYAPELCARQAPPIRVTETIEPVAMTEPEAGVRVFDLGTNIAGWPLLTTGATSPGETITLRPGELLDDTGHVSQRNTGWPIFDSYTSAGDAGSWHPEFTYHGFRYIQVHGPAANVEGLVLRADNEATGSFSCSDDLLNRIHTIIDRAVKGNMFSVLTDCPHREKLGWLEQAHLLFGVVSNGYDVAAYYRDFMRRIAAAQLPSGMVPTTAPEYVVFDAELADFRDDVNWGRAIVDVPWQLYRTYGDDHVLAEYYPAMRRYVGYLESRADDGVLDLGLGDWIATESSTPRAIAATWGYWRTVSTLARIAEVLGRGSEPRRYGQMATHVRAAFQRIYQPGRSQACDVFALDMGIDALDSLVAAIEDHLAVGEIALPVALRVLAAAGRHDLIHRIATRTDHPSYGYQVEHAATALTEAWDGPTRGMSQNHFMLGAIDEWFYSGLAGIGQAADSCGFRRAVIEPALVDGVDHVAAAIGTPFGRLGVSWRRVGDGVEVEVEVPVGAEAELRLPGAAPRVVGSGKWVLRCPGAAFGT